MKHRNALSIETVFLDGVKYARITPIRHPYQFVDIEWDHALEWLDNYDMIECDDLAQVVSDI
ncbi:hypothetical protein BZG76_05995 [Salinivibrio sp. AR647]|uniref:hypothetical protein n=1 Tax=Salinivibrio sp. AR647 TaxID=1909438 RepID=UPI0009864ACF|nr:hypothetical protein [Salinivibrio sp. AR647]OOE92834.1 hypothetical protein BZG76_05995 [Salinivibrio sp. AR647]